MQEGDHVAAAIAVEELPRGLVVEQQLVSALVGTAHDGDPFSVQGGEATRGRE
jgi:hypothetical protein